MLAILCDLLAGHTTAADDCCFCLWEGYGDLENYGWLDREQHVFSSTLVGGSMELAEAIIRHPMLDAWAMQPQDSLAADADKVNIVTP